MKKIFLLLALTATILRAANPGDEVVIVYNSRMPESKAVADYYAAKRNVPTNQIFGFDLPKTETISRDEFADALQKPLAKKLSSQKLWRVGSEISTSTNAESSHLLWRVVETKIRYAVLCYGVPLHIAEDPSFTEPGMEKMRPEFKRNEAAVDSELALLPLLDAHYIVSGPARNPVYTTTNAANINPTNGMLIVARLDGPTPEIARGLVDKAIEAETNGLWGRAYFDLRNINDDAYKTGDEWIAGAAIIAHALGFETVADTNSETFSANFPMSQIALYAGWYDENVSGPFAQPTVEFMPGAIAYHQHSFSAASLRSTNKNWCGPLLAKGATATMGSVAEPYLQAMPDVGTFFGRLLVYSFTFGEAAYASQTSLSWQTTVIGDPLYRRHSKFLEWSYLKLINFALVQKNPPANVLAYLENISARTNSPVLMEKDADLNAALGKPASAIRAYQTALTLNPSPLQRVRLRLALAELLAKQDRAADAIENYRKLVEEAPDWPGKKSIEEKIAALAAKSANTNAPAK